MARLRLLGTFCAVAAVVLVGGDRLRPLLPVTGSAEPVESPRPVRLLAVGDLMLGTSVKSQILRHGPDYPFRKYRRLLTGADVTFGNLETPLSDGGSPTPGKSAESLKNRTNFLFRTPPIAAAGLSRAGFDYVSLANNHTMDYGPEALRDTLAALTGAGVTPVGAGEELDSAFAPVYFERNGQTFALFAISDVLPLGSWATARSPGVAPARGAEFESRMPAAIREAREQADHVLVSVHWGKELYPGATEKQQRLGRRLIDWGAEVVIGHHTHCLGPVERYGSGLIHYSLGNFIGPLSTRRDASAWELTFVPGEPPLERQHLYRWDGVKRGIKTSAPLPALDPAVSR
ncbi:MAG: CapA family protein [Armatimonadota bacterium]